MPDESLSRPPARRARALPRLLAATVVALLVATGVGGSPLGSNSALSSNAALRIAAVSRPGVIKSVCAYTHTAADDPIVKPGQPGAAHSHDFFGNTTVDAFSTLETLKAGDTSCNFAEDRSGYWVPTVYRNGTAVRSSQIVAYYTLDGADAASVRPHPEGLRLVAGDSMATTAQSLDVTSWRCVDSSEQPTSDYSSGVPSCAAGNSLQLSVHFPQCWDGTSLDSANHKSHLAYLANTRASCPADHPVLLPSLTLFALYPITGGSGVTLASGGQYSAHGDFFNAWEPARLADLVTGCLVQNMSCGPGLLTVDETFSTESQAMNFNVRLSSSSPSTVEVDYATGDVTAVAPGDYTAVSGRLTFPPGSLAQTVTVQIVDDSLSENDEALVLNLSNPVNAALGTDSRIGTILDNDSGGTISAGDATRAEPVSGTRALTSTLTLSEVSDRTVTVQYTTVDGTAVQPADYAAASGTVTFAPGVTTKTVGVAINADSLSTEGNETLTLVLSNPANASISDGTALLTITDPTVVPKLYVANATTPESGTASFLVTLSTAASSAVSVDYAAVAGSATSPADFPATSGRLVIPAGSTAGYIQVPIVQDAISEGDETFQLVPSNATGAVIITKSATGIITDDDPLPTLEITDASVPEPSSGTRTLKFTVRLTGAVGRAVTFNWATSNGTAVAPGDYVAASGSLTLPVGVTTKTISVTVNADAINEGTEAFNVILSSVVGAMPGDFNALGTITPP